MLGGDSEWEPPDTISNSVVKTLSADDSVGFPHVKVGHRQALFTFGATGRRTVVLVEVSVSRCVQGVACGREWGQGRAVQSSAQSARFAFPVDNSQFNYGCRALCGNLPRNESDTRAGSR